MPDSKMIVRTRVAPSPTGEIHIGTLRTILYDYALARKNNGQFVWRVEDTDQKRLVAGSMNRMMQTVKSYGLLWDEGPDIGGPFGPYVQTERLEIYQKYIQELLDKGLAYKCFSTPEELEAIRSSGDRRSILRFDRKWLTLSEKDIQAKVEAGEKYYIRMKVPDNQIVEFEDLVRGVIKTSSNEIDDQVIVKSNGIPTYHFAATVDDYLMNITHTLRAEEWLPSTPKHALLCKFFGWTPPKYVHLTVLLDPNKPGKMSKRSGSTHAQGFLDEGYLPEAMLNFLMLLGWNSGEDREIMSLEEFVEKFDITKLNKKAAIFDRKKLDFFNGYYLRQKTTEDLFPLYQKFLPQLSTENLNILIPITKERIFKLSDLKDMCKFLYEDIATEKPLEPDMLKKALELIVSQDLATIQPKFMQLIADNNWKVGDFFKELRQAISGQKITPPIVECLAILGKEKVVSRLQRALDLV